METYNTINWLYFQALQITNGLLATVPVAYIWKNNLFFAKILVDFISQNIGEWPSGKAPASGAGDRRFESFLPSQCA